MNVIYFVKLLRKLLDAGASKSEIASELGFRKQNMNEIFGDVPEKQRQNLKDEHLPGLLRLCRNYKVGPQTAKQLLDLIEKEKRGEV